MKSLNNKWINGLIPAILVYISMGMIYCWSMIKGEIAYAMSCSVTDIEIAFSISLLCLGLTTMLAGKLVDYSEKISVGLSTGLFVAGMAGSVAAIKLGLPWMFILMYGVVQGIALGLGYLSPIKTLMAWFKNKKGWILGLVMASFAGSKILFSPIIGNMLQTHDITYVMGVLCIIGMCCMCIATLLLKAPYDIVHERVSWKTIKDNIFNTQFVSIWGMVFLVVASAVAMISYEKSMMLHIDFVNVTTAVTIIACFNVAGRLLIPVFTQQFSDKARSYVYMLFVCVVSVVIALISLTPFTLMMMLCLCNFCYGGVFASVPILLHDRFGTKNLALLHGLLLSAWAVGGFFGDVLANFLFELLGSGGHVELIRKFFVFYMGALAITFYGLFNKKR